MEAIGGVAPTREGGLFRIWQIDLMANTLGAGFDLSRHSIATSTCAEEQI
jgi:hypothetical protein